MKLSYHDLWSQELSRSLYNGEWRHLVETNKLKIFNDTKCCIKQLV